MGVARQFSAQITSCCIWVPNLLVELVFIGIHVPVVWTNGWAYSHVLSKFLGWLDYHIFLGKGLCLRALHAHGAPL